MSKVLFTASTYSHIVNFHRPYLAAFRQLGWRVEVACGGYVQDLLTDLEQRVQLGAQGRAGLHR